MQKYINTTKIDNNRKKIKIDHKINIHISNIIKSSELHIGFN
jgi:hypothetical protein